MFKYADSKTGTETEYYANCDGLALADCSHNRSLCDPYQNYYCGDWTDVDTGKVTIGCANGAWECGLKFEHYYIECSGLAGDECKKDN